MSILESAFLGLLQGLAEFLPVSSSGHLLLARLFLGIQTDTPAMKMLDILLHVGTLIPVVVIFCFLPLQSIFWPKNCFRIITDLRFLIQDGCWGSVSCCRLLSCCFSICGDAPPEKRRSDSGLLL